MLGYNLKRRKRNIYVEQDLNERVERIEEDEELEP